MSGPTCKSCGAPVVWARAGKKSAPLIFNRDPSPKGSFTINHGFANAIDLLTPKDAPRFVPHWADCPHADQWRKKR